MFRLIFILFLIISNVKFGLAQHFEVHYRESIVRDITKNFNNAKIAVNDWIFISDGIESYYYSGVKNYSKFIEKQDSVMQDAIFYADKTKAVNQVSIKSLVSYDSVGNVLYINKRKDSIWNKQYSNGYILTQERIPEISWKISEDSKTILNYKAFKATCHFRGRDYEAWFTTDIPIIAYPWKFTGLPGLVLLLTDNDNQVKIEATSINIPAKNPFPEYSFTGKKISLQQYFTFMTDYMRLRFEKMQKKLDDQDIPDIIKNRPDFKKPKTSISGGNSESMRFIEKHF